jgi:uncharacterized integral membrane protein (TIGR00697 family)
MTLSGRSLTLYHWLATSFCLIVVVSNVISAKMVPLPFFDNFLIPAGLITYPFTFILSDLVTELYDAAHAKRMVLLALGISLLAYLLFQLAMWLPSSDKEVHAAFHIVFGWNGLLVAASLAAFVTAQILDVQIYAWIKKWTGTGQLWLRNNGSTLLSQVVDTLMVNMIHLFWARSFPLETVLQIMALGYAYKAALSVANTPIFYLLVFFSKKYLHPQWHSEHCRN